jgi:quercetin dioxygenase-like cupin family protein
MTAPVIVPAAQGRIIRAFGSEITVHLDGSQTGGKFTMFTDLTPPGGGPPAHYHENEDEWWLVLAGRALFLAEGKWREVSAGDSVFAPRKSVHTFKNIGDQPLKQLIHTSPSGFENFFARCAEEFARPGAPAMDRIIAISAEYGIHYVNL